MRSQSQLSITLSPNLAPHCSGEQGVCESVCLTAYDTLQAY